MSKDLMISLLRKGNNGAQILEILDTLSEQVVDTVGATVNHTHSLDLQRSMLQSPATVVVNYSGESVTI